MNYDITGTAHAKYGIDIYRRDHYTCAYCGFDGRTFDAWRQLSIDHISPIRGGGLDKADNVAVVCRSCNAITRRMKFPEDMSRIEGVLLYLIVQTACDIDIRIWFHCISMALSVR